MNFFTQHMRDIAFSFRKCFKTTACKIAAWHTETDKTTVMKLNNIERKPATLIFVDYFAFVLTDHLTT